MTATLESDIDAADRMDEVRFTRLQRLRAFREQIERADWDADAGSLDRATDMAEEFEQKEWVKELPEVTKSHYRGQPIKADGLSRFAGWAKANIGFAPRHVYQLVRANEVHGILCAAAQSIPPGTGEWALRPLSKLLNHKDKRPDEIPQVWQRALKFSADEAPTNKQVGNALRAHDVATGRTPADRTAAYYQRTVKEAHDKAVRAAKWIRQYGTEENQKDLLLAIHDVFTSTSDSTE